MMNHKELNEIIEKWEIELIEKHLIYYFLQLKQIDSDVSPILNDYLDKFEKNNTLLSLIENLQIQNLKDLESILELIIPNQDKKFNGAFFTPKFIVDFIVEQIQPKYYDQNLDPSCGSGAFLIGIVEFYKRIYNKSIKETIRENIYGADIMSYNIRRTKLILTLFALENNEIVEEFDFNLSIQDSIRTNWKNVFKNCNGIFNNVFGNPPYVKFQDLSEQNREYLVNNFSTISNGTFNLYFAFFELGFKLLTPGGKLGYITPNNYFTSLAGESLRIFFESNKCISRIIDFKDKKVFDAQTYTAITLISKENNDEFLYDRIPQRLEPFDFIKNVNGSTNKISELNHKKWRLLKSDEMYNINSIENIGQSIGDMFNIAVGVATLKDDIYFIDTLNETEGFYIKNYNNRSYQIEKKITKLIYKISDFKSQKDIFNNKRRIIFPYKIVNNVALPYSEIELEILFPKIFEYFSDVKDELAKRDKGKIVKPYFAYGRTQGLTRNGTMILTPTFSQSPRFLLAPEKEAFYCNGYGIYFKEKNIDLFNNSSNPLGNSENINELLKVLNSYIMDYYISITSVSIQGGYPCYQKNFIEKFSIPFFSDDELNDLRNLKSSSEIDRFLIKKYQLNIPLPNLDS